MPNRDGTGPYGAGGGGGQRRRYRCRPGSGLSGFVLELIINNWMTMSSKTKIVCSNSAAIGWTD